MEQTIINNGDEFVINTKTALIEDSIYFKDNGDYISIAIEKSGGDEAEYVVYKKAAVQLSEWLKKYV